MNRSYTLRRKAITPQAKAIQKLDTAVSNPVRTHYAQEPCCTCGNVREKYDCGHFRGREAMSTRFDLRNLGKQCLNCNRFRGGESYEFSKFLGKFWGKGTAELMVKRARTIKQWEVKNLEQLTAAARLGWLPYLTLYNELHP